MTTLFRFCHWSRFKDVSWDNERWAEGGLFPAVLLWLKKRNRMKRKELKKEVSKGQILTGSEPSLMTISQSQRGRSICCYWVDLWPLAPCFLPPSFPLLCIFSSSVCRSSLHRAVTSNVTVRRCFRPQWTTSGPWPCSPDRVAAEQTVSVLFG